MSKFPEKIKTIIATLCGNFCVQSRDKVTHRRFEYNHNYYALKCQITRNWKAFSKSLGLQTTHEQVLLTSIMVEVSVIEFHRSPAFGSNPGQMVAHTQQDWSSLTVTSKLILGSKYLVPAVELLVECLVD